jgi:hypothetical protein
MKILNPNDFYSVYLENHLSYYGMYSDFKNAKLALLDHIFNVIGNGIRDTDEFINFISSNEKSFNLKHTISLYEKKFYSGFDSNSDIDVNKATDDELVDFFSRTDNFHHRICENDLHLYKDVKVWEEDTKKIKRNPYPNFSKKYSIIYNLNFDLLGEQKEYWINEAITFYKDCIVYLNSEESMYHSNAYPTDDKAKDEAVISSFKKALDKYETNEDASKAYEQDYNGNVEEFVIVRWEKNKKEWMAFCHNSIDFLKEKL